MLESFNALSDYRPTLKQENVRGRRLALATTALRSPPMHPEARLKGESLDFRRKARVSRRAGVIDGCRLTVREVGKCRFICVSDSQSSRGSYKNLDGMALGPGMTAGWKFGRKGVKSNGICIVNWKFSIILHLYF